jgi:hypothetical protein
VGFQLIRKFKQLLDHDKPPLIGFPTAPLLREPLIQNHPLVLQLFKEELAVFVEEYPLVLGVLRESELAQDLDFLLRDDLDDQEVKEVLLHALDESFLVLDTFGGEVLVVEGLLVDPLQFVVVSQQHLLVVVALVGVLGLAELSDVVVREVNVRSFLEDYLTGADVPCLQLSALSQDGKPVFVGPCGQNFFFRRHP